MTTDDMLKHLHTMKVSAEAINAELKRTHTTNEDHRWDNTWIAYLTSGKLMTDIIMLINLLQRVSAEGKE